MRVDSHIHVWGQELLEVRWLNSQRNRLIRRAISVEEASQVARRRGVESFVAVTADESLSGTRRLLARCARNDFTGAVVGWVDLKSPIAGNELDTLLASDGGELFRGVRLVALDPGVLEDPSGHRGLEALQRRGLLLDVLVNADGLDPLARLISRYPALTVILDHVGAASGSLGQDQWVSGMRLLAMQSNVNVKVSGVALARGLLDRQLNYLRDLFGTDRLMAGSDWPMSTVEARDPWRELERLSSDWDSIDQSNLFGATAHRVFRIQSAEVLRRS
ncbi:L-fuconolactonase [Microbacterium sp. SLBN-154]|uniref:amidohydrolase family protein n=1 Tax=Microbacterium sp. SLBN-154 TaxID=2768458 RepID=UPI0011528FB9|nr:amidohydrolase family protein [Microbacterium sp. SLBN-154]TQK17705.1 L-fuconolactonase [Microbacterium sp. SLBN-154]